MRRILLFAIVAVMALSLTACKNDVQSDFEQSQSTSLPPTFEKVTTSVTDESDISTPSVDVESEFYGSFLTMARDVQNNPESAYFKVVRNFTQIQDFYDVGSEYYIYGKNLTITLASFDDDFMADHDVLIFVINEPSSYITHSNASISLSNGKAIFNISRLIIENATMSDTCYHLIFTGEKGAFDKIDGLDLSVGITETVTKEKNAAGDAEGYLYSYPEYLPFVYKTVAFSDPTPEIDTIESYDELVSYYEQHKNNYELDAFKRHIGSLYDESIFDDYILLTILLPYDNSKKTPKIDELFVYNSEIYISVKNSSDAIISSTTASCLLITAVSKSDLQGVNMSVFNISFN